jgi:hypothetical protein
MQMIKKLADALTGLTWWILLILVIFVDGLVGGVIRIANGKKTSSKVVGWILLISFILSIISIIDLGIIGTIARIVYLICFVADIVTVVLYKKIMLFAD